MQFCEEQLCGWVTEPANTWSNIGFFVVGLYVIFLSRRENQPTLMPIGVIAILLFFGSTLFHMTSTFWGEVLDIFAMFLFATFMLCFNLWRLAGWRRQKLFAVYGIVNLVALLLLLNFKPAGIALFTLIVTAAGIIELRLFLRRAPTEDYRPLLWLILTFSLAFTIWRLDVAQRICDPQNHILQGHSIWHLLNAFCFYFLYRFYAQYSPDRHAPNRGISS